MEIIKMNVKDLNPASYNPRKRLAPGDLEYEQIKQSILSFGMVEPIVWNRQTGNIVAGHQRYTVLCDLGNEKVDVSVIVVSEEQEKALNIALNKISGDWDGEKLSALLEELAADANEMLVGLTGFTQEELDEMFSSDGLGDENSDSNDAECGAPEKTEEESSGSHKPSFNYQEQFGVIVLCKDESEQRDVYEKLVEQGYACRVVAT